MHSPRVCPIANVEMWRRTHHRVVEGGSRVETLGGESSSWILRCNGGDVRFRAIYARH